MARCHAHCLQDWFGEEVAYLLKVRAAQEDASISVGPRDSRAMPIGRSRKEAGRAPASVDALTVFRARQWRGLPYRHKLSEAGSGH